MKINTYLKKVVRPLGAALSALLCLSLLPLSAIHAQPQTQEQGAKSITHTEEASVRTLPDKANRYALVIGVDKYTSDSNITPLNGASNDAIQIAEALVKYAGFEKDKVIVLTSNEVDTTRQPSRTVILSALKNLKNLIAQDGMLLVAFSGHGVERKNDGRVYLLPADASSNPDDYEDTAISVNRVKELIRQTKASQVMLLLDSCRNDPTAGRGQEDNKLSDNYIKSFSFDRRNSGINAFVTLYAASEGQRAWEYQEKKQGYFSWAFVEALKGAAADQNTGEVTLNNLIGYVEKEVQTRAKWKGREQKPYAVMEGYGGGLVLSKPIEPKKAAPAPVPVAAAPVVGTLSVVSESGAQIVIEPLTGDKSKGKKGAISDGQRFYTFDSLPLGTYRVAVTRDGYNAASKQIEITAANSKPVVDLPLKPLTYSLTVKTNLTKGRVEVGAQGEAPRVFDLEGGQKVFSDLRQGDYAIRIIPDDPVILPKSETVSVRGDLTREYKLQSHLRAQPLMADFSLREQWQLPAAWRVSPSLELSGEGVALLKGENGRFANLELSANVELIDGSAAQFILRAQDEQNYYGVRVSGLKDAEAPKKLRVFVVKNGVERVLQTFPLAASMIAGQFSFTVRMNGKEIAFFLINEEGKPELVGSLTDDTFAAGTVGISARAGDRAKIYSYYICPGNCPQN